MKTIPVRMLITIGTTLAIAGIVLLLLVRPMAVAVLKDFSEAVDHYSSKNKSVYDAALRKNASLRQLEKKIATIMSMPEERTPSYGSLQKFLKQSGIQAVKITGGTEGAGEADKGMVKNEFTIQFIGTYHEVGKLISDLENGPFICNVKSMHAVQKTYVTNMLSIELTVVFYRMVRGE